MELTLIEFVMTIVVGCCGLVLVALLISRTLRARGERKSLERRVICRLCLHAFEVRNGQEVVQCPECGVANERISSQRWI